MEIIHVSLALPMINGGPVIEDAALAYEFGKIHGFGTLKEIKGRYPDAPVKSYEDSILLPGLVNAHCHLDLVSYYNPFIPSEEMFPEQTDFIENLVSIIDYKQEADPNVVVDGIQKGILRLIETGVTCVGDMTSFEGTFRLLREMGLRAVVFPEILAGRGEAAQHSFEIGLALIEKYTDASHDRVRVGLGPYAPYVLSRNLLKIISEHAKETSIPISMHAAESFAEMEFFFDSQGPIATDLFPTLGWNELPPAHRATPVSYLSEIGFLEAPTTVIGAVQLSGNDFPLLARNLVKAVYCPTSNKVMKHGTFPLGKLTEHGIAVGLGTECWYTRLGFNLWEEMRLAITRGSDPLPSAKQAMFMATVGGSRALGLDHLIGTLEAGKKADFIVIGKPAGDLSEANIYDEVVRKTEPQHIKLVVVNGGILKST
jgi:cytosine/adenosine deaminase-related metal-dependent hydrolase